MKIYSGTYSYELHMRKSDDVYIHMYFKNFRETEGHLHALLKQEQSSIHILERYWRYGQIE
ncbi:hypothetical protein ACMGD3_06130 [Lysinibacillus sphaericus]